MTGFKPCLAVAAALFLAATPVPAVADPVKNIVLVHGAWVDASGWKAIYDILAKGDFNVTMVQEPETSFADDDTATKRVLDLQDGPTLLVGHSYGGSIITEAGVHPNVVGLVYVAAHAPDVGEDEGELSKKTPSLLAKTEGAVKTTPDSFTYLNPPDFPKLFAPDLPRGQAEFEARSQVLAAASVFNTPLTAAAWRTKPSWGVVAGGDQIINPDLERWYYERAKSHTTEIAGASHSVYESHPQEVAAVITDAARSVSSSGVSDSSAAPESSNTRKDDPMRLPLIAPDDLSPEQRALYEDMRAGIEKNFQGFATIAKDGALVGPWNPWLHEPKFGKPIWELTKALSFSPSLPKPIREVAILVTGAKFRAAYEIYAHVLLAEQRGLSDDKIATIVAGQRPSNLTREEAIAYDVASALVDHGPLPELTYRQAVQTFGEHGAAELIYLVGLYCLVSVTLNGFDVPVPEAH